MIKPLFLVGLVVFLSGCSLIPWFKQEKIEPIKIETIAQERIKLNLELPEPLILNGVEWRIVTPDNIHEVWDEMGSRSEHMVLFAITASGYERLSVDMVNIRNFIAAQRMIIIKYQEYYEPDN